MDAVGAAAAAPVLSSCLARASPHTAE